MKKQFKTNLGSVDAKAFGLDYTKCHAGDVVDLSAETVKLITEKYPLMLLDPGEDIKGVATVQTIKGVEEESPVSQVNADEAIAGIANMRSKDKLQHVIDNDTRVSVKEAARKRLAAL